MAVEVYYREAAKRLQDAVTALHDEIHTIQNEAYRAEVQLHNDISRAEVEHGERRAEMMATADMHMKAGLEARVRQLDGEIRAKKDEVSHTTTDAARVVQAKNGLISTTQSLINQLESLAASAK